MAAFKEFEISGVLLTSMLLIVTAVRNQSTPMDDDTRTAEIEAEFEGWHVWLSDTGRWWAARKTSLTAAESSAGCVQYLQADSPEELREQIIAEETLSARLAERRSNGDVHTQRAEGSQVDRTRRRPDDR